MNIKEAAARTGLSPDTLRYYEKEGLIPPVPRNASGYRDYGEHAVQWVEFLRCFRNAGVPLSDFARYVQLAFSEGDTREERRQLLLDIRARLKDQAEHLQNCLDLIEAKIAKYDELCDPVTMERVAEWKGAAKAPGKE
jgi:DNA-binding transcriptional MerR regulator